MFDALKRLFGGGGGDDRLDESSVVGTAQTEGTAAAASPAATGPAADGTAGDSLLAPPDSGAGGSTLSDPLA